MRSRTCSKSRRRIGRSVGTANATLGCLVAASRGSLGQTFTAAISATCDRNNRRPELRHGEVTRILKHGTAIVWDADAKRGFPYYGRIVVDVGDRVRFVVNQEATRVEDLWPEAQK